MCRVCVGLAFREFGFRGVEVHVQGLLVLMDSLGVSRV